MTLPYRGGIIKQDIFSDECLRLTNYSKLPNDAKTDLLDALTKVTTDPAVEAYCKKYGIKLNLNMIYEVFRSYCKFCAKQLAEGVMKFWFPNLGSFNKRDTTFAESNAELGTLKGDAKVIASRKISLDFHKKFNQTAFDKMIRLKKKQWDLK